MPGSYLETGYNSEFEYGADDVSLVEARQLGSQGSQVMQNTVVNNQSPQQLLDGDIINPLILAKTAFIRGGASGYDDGSGFFLGWDKDTEQYVFFIGDSTSGKLTYNPTDGLEIVGDLKPYFTGTAGEDLVDNRLVRLASDGKIYYTSALISDLSDITLGLTTAAVDEDDPGLFQTTGVGEVTGLTAGDVYYLSDGNKDQEFTNNDSFESIYSGAPTDYGQTFTTGSGVVKLDAVALYGKRGVTGAGNLTVDVFATSSGVPTGSTLGTSEPRDSASFSTSNEWQVFYFETPITLSPSTLYAITVTPAGGTVINTYDWANETSGTYTGGTGIRNSGSWSTSTEDFNFRTYEFDGTFSTSPGTVEKTAGFAVSTTDLVLKF